MQMYWSAVFLRRVIAETKQALAEGRADAMREMARTLKAMGKMTIEHFSAVIFLQITKTSIIFAFEH